MGGLGESKNQIHAALGYTATPHGVFQAQQCCEDLKEDLPIFFFFSILLKAVIATESMRKGVEKKMRSCV